MIRRAIVIAALLLPFTAAQAVSTIKPPPPWYAWGGWGDWFDGIKKLAGR